MTLPEQPPTPRVPWTEVAATKRSVRDAQIKEQQHVVSTHNDRITSIADIEHLTRSIKERVLSAEDIVKAYIAKKGKVTGSNLECLLTICFRDAICQAKALDEFQRNNGRLIGPLHGVVMSVKDQFNIQGIDSTLGYASRAFKPATSDALMVQFLKQQGAVVIAKTNLPQSIMWCETENPIFGLTTHPLNAELTPGSSSGGEAALLALHGSMVGWGTDIGGSIRIPSHMNGLWGLKPSAARMSYEGVEVTLSGQQHVPSAVGPMARSLESLTTVTKAVIEAKLWTLDAQLPPLPWRDEFYGHYSRRPLVVGTMLDDGAVKVHPSIESVFRSTVSKLKVAGHEIVEWDVSLNAECIAIMDAYYSADGGEDVRRAVTDGGEPFLPHVQAFINRAPSISVYEYWQLNKRKVKAQQAYMDLWNRTRSPSGRPVDVLLLPTMPHTAVPHRSCRWVGYTKLFNFLDYTALSFPAGKASKDVQNDELSTGYKARNDIDAWNWGLYDSDKMEGHDVGLQIVGCRFDEEKVLGAALQIESLLK
ncbi:amidase, partial [Phaeosphaeria sp. MPI-PUGE-AT-0046c]